MVFVYHLGSNWKDKKVISHKFPVTEMVTCLTWPSRRPDELVFGLVSGKVCLCSVVLFASKRNRWIFTDFRSLSLISFAWQGSRLNLGSWNLGVEESSSHNISHTFRIIIVLSLKRACVASK
jgi:hypothetical protein